MTDKNYTHELLSVTLQRCVDRLITRLEISRQGKYDECGLAVGHDLADSLLLERILDAWGATPDLYSAEDVYGHEANLIGAIRRVLDPTEWAAQVAERRAVAHGN